MVKLGVLGILAIMGACNATAAATVTAVVGEYEPFTSPDPNGPKVTEELVIAAYGAVGHDVIISRAPWKRCYELVKSGKFDITFPYSYSELRAQEVTFSAPFMASQEVMFHSKKVNFDWSGRVDELAQYKLAGILGYRHLDVYQGAELNYQLAKDYHDAFLLLFKGRVDAVPLNPIVGEYFLQSEYPDQQAQITYHPIPFSRRDWHVLSTDNGNDYVRLFDLGMARIKRSGVFNTIINQYK